MPEIPKSPFQETPDPDADMFADFDALAGEVVTTAQENLWTSELVSSASADKPKARSRGVRKEADQGSDVEKVRSLWVQKTGKAIAEAKNLEQLMKMVDSIEGRKSKKLSFPLPEGLPTLLKNNQEFSKEFNDLFGRWSERAAELFLSSPEDTLHFQNFLHSVISENPTIPSGRFFGMYLDRSDLSLLGGIPSVITKMKEIWDQQLPIIKQELKAGKNRSKEIALGGAYVLKNDPSKEYKVTEISDDGEITYVSLDGGLPAHS